MSIAKCYDCGKDVDTDHAEFACFLDKYYVCGKCLDKDEIYEIMDTMQVNIDRLKSKVAVRDMAIQDLRESKKTSF